MPTSLITNSGRVLMARLLKGDSIGGITHCAIGDGDNTFTNPLLPPPPTPTQTGLKNELARKRYYKRAFLQVDESNQAALVVEGVHYNEVQTPTSTIGVFFAFTEQEANGITMKEYGFFGGGVTYRPGVSGDYAANGVYNAGANPTGQVAAPGLLYEVKNVPDFVKASDTRMEIVGVIKL